VLGFYRSYYRSVDGKRRGFAPAEQGAQVKLGEKIMRIMSHWGDVVAEDLGDVPPFLRPSLERLNVPGYRVLRWEMEGDAYRDPASWPAASVATNATHDTTTTAEWYDAMTDEERAALVRLPRLAELDPAKPFDDRVRDMLLASIYAAPSALALSLYQDIMGRRERINIPGTMDAANWSYRIDRSVDDLLADGSNTDRLARLAAESGRAKPPRR
jgi:4-alpha-glucanotransferase